MVTLVTWNILPVSAVIVPPVMVKAELPSLASPDMAKKLGAAYTVNFTTENAQEKVMQITGKGAAI